MRTTNETKEIPVSIEQIECLDYTAKGLLLVAKAQQGAFDQYQEERYSTNLPKTGFDDFFIGAQGDLKETITIYTRMAASLRVANRAEICPLYSRDLGKLTVSNFGYRFFDRFKEEYINPKQSDVGRWELPRSIAHTLFDSELPNGQGIKPLKSSSRRFFELLRSGHTIRLTYEPVLDYVI